MNKNKIILPLIIVILFGTSFESYAKKTKRVKGEKPIVRSFMLSGGAQFGIGLPFNSNKISSLSTAFSHSQNNHFYLKLRLKKFIISGGVRTSFFDFKNQAFKQSIESTYSKSDFEINSGQISATAEVVTPYIGFGYKMKYSKIEFEPFIRLGLGVLNYQIGDVNLTSQNSNILDQTISFYDYRSELFFNPSIGLNGARRISNLFKFTASVAFDFGNPCESELQEITIQKPYQTIRMRNIYLQNSMNNLYFMIGLEITPFNRIYSNERKYEKLKNKVTK